MPCQLKNPHQVYIWLKNNQFCLLCDAATDDPLPLCVACEAELPWLGQQCEVCALPLPKSGMVCGECLKKPPPFTRVEAPWLYGFPVDTLITRFKHQARWPLGRLLGELLARALQHRFADGLARPDALLAVPMGRKRLRQRGYNQAAMLAAWLSEHLHLPLHTDWLLRTQDTLAQQDLDAAARLRNLRHAFALSPDAQVVGQHFALVDDVLTTGATARQLAQLLRQAGAARVDVYCLARTPKPGG